MRRHAIFQVTAATGAVAAFVLALIFLAGCGARMSLEDQYRAEVLQCVDDSKTLAESKACRALKDAKFGVDGGVR